MKGRITARRGRTRLGPYSRRRNTICTMGGVSRLRGPLLFPCRAHVEYHVSLFAQSSSLPSLYGNRLAKAVPTDRNNARFPTSFHEGFSKGLIRLELRGTLESRYPRGRCFGFLDIHSHGKEYILPGSWGFSDSQTKENIVETLHI